MATIDQFTKAWRRTDKPESTFSQEIFPNGSILLIGLADGTKCHVMWHNVQKLCWCASSIPFQADCLKGEHIQVMCPQEQPYELHVALWLENNHLRGEFGDAEGSGPVGTFTASADDWQEGVDATRLEESIAV